MPALMDRIEAISKKYILSAARFAKLVGIATFVIARVSPDTFEALTRPHARK